MNDVTRILNAVEAGNPQAAEQLLPLVYDELCKLAQQKLAQEKPGQTLEGAALVHEAYLRLVTGAGDDAVQSQPCWTNRGHFFAAAAEAMRRILVETARRKQRCKHGGGRSRLPLEEIALDDAPTLDILALDEALTKFAALDATAAQIVQLRYFSGMTLSEAAAHLNISPRTADRLWAYARAWLREELRDFSAEEK